MSFYESFDKLSDHPFPIHGDGKLCAFCADRLAGPTIVYDMQLNPNSITGLAMHRDCAFAMAQRLITDAWPNRHKTELMKNNR